MAATIRIGTAGWSLPVRWQDRFPGGGSHLARYARVLACTEINATFKALPRPATADRWRETVPGTFRFAAKAPRAITHVHRLAGAEEALGRFLEVVGRLGDRLGPLLFQLPPSLAFDRRVAAGFLQGLRRAFAGPVALEPRHPSWFRPEAEGLLARHRVARVAADPPRAAADGLPGGHGGLAYFRLHGTPRRYASPYRGHGLEQWALRVEEAARAAEEVWCIFDNTAAGEATADALALKELLGVP